MPFRTPTLREKHYILHGHDFGAEDEFEYERMADAFMSGAVPQGTIQVFRIHEPRNRLRLEIVTRFFGVESPDFFIRTFFIKGQANINDRGGPAAFMEFKRTQVKE